MTSQKEFNNAAAMLKRYGYEVEQKANNCFNPYLVVQDPVYACGTNGLVFSHDEPVIIRSYDSARKFVNSRS